MNLPSISHAAQTRYDRRFVALREAQPLSKVPEKTLDREYGSSDVNIILILIKIYYISADWKQRCSQDPLS